MQFGLPGLLFILFLILKLTHTIDWTWWWVASPLWISGLLAFVLFVIWIILAFGLSMDFSKRR